MLSGGLMILLAQAFFHEIVVCGWIGRKGGLILTGGFNKFSSLGASPIYVKLICVLSGASGVGGV